MLSKSSYVVMIFCICYYVILYASFVRLSTDADQAEQACLAMLLSDIIKDKISP